MKALVIGVNKAKMVDDRGVIFTAVKDGDVWMFEGLAYDSPFKAFRNLERSLNKWKKL